MRQLPLVHSNLLIVESRRCECCQLTCREELFLPRWKGGQRGGQGGCDRESVLCPCTACALCSQMAVPWVPAAISLPRAGQVCPSLAGTVHLGTRGQAAPQGRSRQGHCAVVSSFGAEPVNRASCAHLERCQLLMLPRASL